MFDWIVSLVEQTGYLGIAALMLLENVFPPIPSELIMPLAGFSAARGDLDIVLVILAGTIGSVLGALFWFYIGKWVGTARLKRWTERHGRWMTIAPEEVDSVSRWFRERGGIAIFIGRLVPAIRTLISVPAGVAGMGLPKFLAYTSLGTAIWTAFLAGTGYVLEAQFHRISDWVNPVSNVVVVLAVLYYIYRVVTFPRRHPR